MNDVIDRLGALSTTAGPPDDASVTADLRRGRRALARRRTVRGAGAGAVLLAAAGVTIAALTSGSGSTHSSDHGLRLVDYRGKQLPGFTVGEVPEGFILQGADASVLDIARPGDHSVLDDFEGKIVISVEDSSPPPDPGPRYPSPQARMRLERQLMRTGRGTISYTCPDGSTHSFRVTRHSGIPNVCHPTSAGSQTAGRAIDVDGAKGRITTNSEGAKYFRFTAADRTVTIQVWPTIDLTDAQLRELADGITVSASAEISHG